MEARSTAKSEDASERQTCSGITPFEVPTVSLHVHERIDPRSIIEAVRRRNGEDFVQGSLFSQIEENPPLRDKHKHNWSNRLIAGDSLLVLVPKEDPRCHSQSA